MSNLLTRQEAAKYLRISPRTVDRLIAERQLPVARIGGRRLVFPQDVLDKYVQQQLRKGL